MAYVEKILLPEEYTSHSCNRNRDRTNNIENDNIKLQNDGKPEPPMYQMLAVKQLGHPVLSYIL